MLFIQVNHNLRFCADAVLLDSGFDNRARIGQLQSLAERLSHAIRRGEGQLAQPPDCAHSCVWENPLICEYIEKY